MRSRMLAASLGVMSFIAFGGNALADSPTPPPPSPTGELPVTVLTVLTPDAFEAADALTVALKRAVEDVPGYTTADSDQSLQVLELTLGCGDPGAAPGSVLPDATCEEKISDRIKAQRFVWARITKKGASIRGDLHFYQRGLPTSSAPLDYSANLTIGVDETLIQVARAALEQAGAGPPKGKVKVTVGTVTGQVFIDGKKAGDIIRGVGEYEVAAGSHKLVVRTPEGPEMATDFQLAAFATANVSLTPPPPPTPGIDPKIFVGAGLAAAGIGLGIGGLYATLKVHSIQSDFDTNYRRNYSTSENACTTKKDPLPVNHNQVLELCNSASTFKTEQEVLYPIAAVAAGVGFTLLGVATYRPKIPPESAIQVEPWAGKNSGFLSVRARF